MEQEKCANLRKQLFHPLRTLVRGRDRPVIGRCQDFLKIHSLTGYKDPRPLQVDIAPAISGIDKPLAVEACELPACHSLIVATYCRPFSCYVVDYISANMLRCRLCWHDSQKASFEMVCFPGAAT